MNRIAIFDANDNINDSNYNVRFPTDVIRFSPMSTYRLAVFADIHGNVPALEAVLEDLAHYGPLDGYLVAGDMLGGPGQQAVLERLVALGAVMIQGNGEQRVAQMIAGTAPSRFYTSRQAVSTRWFYEHLTPDLHKLVSALPEQRTFSLHGIDNICIVHGSPRQINELVLPRADFHPNHFYEPVVLRAHDRSGPRAGAGLRAYPPTLVYVPGWQTRH